MYDGKEFNQFAVSNEGKIKNVNTGRVYKTFINKKGYEQLCVSLGSRNAKKVFRIHKVVAETFIPNPDNKPEVNHKDGNKLNNHVSNLEWSTGSENMKHAAKTGLLNPKRGVDNYWAKLTIEDVVYIRKHYVPRDRTYGSRALGRKFNVDHGTILDIIHGVAYVND